jgi:glycosyltransferase involved in cell wall biosynthesis
MKNIRVAIFLAKFDPTLKNPWLTDELCEALDIEGCLVDVFFLDWYSEFEEGTALIYENTRVHIIAPFGSKSSLVSKMLHWTLSSYGVYRYYKSNFKSDFHDTLIVFSPSVMFGIALLGLKSAFKHRILIQWDFFPYHQEQIGLIPFKWITRIGAILETKLLSTFTFIGCMSPWNVEYLISHYKLPSTVMTGVISLWAKVRPKPIINRNQLRTQYQLPLDKTIVVFGGQIAAGRGIEDIIAMAHLAKEKAHPVHFLVIGTGPKLSWLKSEAAQMEGFISVLPQVPRDQYIELIASCDIGLVMTVPNVNIPSFPSKTLDYCCVAIPILAAVEKSTDYGHIVTEGGFGNYCDAGNPSDFYRLIYNLSEDINLREKMGWNARKFYEMNFDVKNTILKISEIMKQTHV